MGKDARRGEDERSGCRSTRQSGPHDQTMVLFQFRNIVFFFFFVQMSWISF